VEFHFDGGIKYEIIRCKRGATVEAEVRIKRVALRPDLRVAEASDDTVGVHLVGDIVGIKRGCKWE
ncbi:MAG: hypothetical protein KJ749_06655, partial [Planctomycetes bacterium]|nr:hypothetical protein [Planctomycetota bacterium]